MTPDQFQVFLDTNKRNVEETIKVVVNGKIDSLREEVRQHSIKHETDMEEIKPVLEAYKGTKVVGEIMKWISSVGLGAWGLYAVFRGLK